MKPSLYLIKDAGLNLYAILSQPAGVCIFSYFSVLAGYFFAMNNDEQRIHVTKLFNRVEKYLQI